MTTTLSEPIENRPASFRPYKFIVQAVVQEVEETDGQEPDWRPGERVVGEMQAEPVTVFGCDELARWAAEFPDSLARAAG